jgi:uncharacterized protein YabE (DUF348 family)
MLRARVLVVQALALVVLVTGGAAFASMHRSVTLVVDGEARQVEVFARSVGEALQRLDIETGPRDLVIPALDAPIVAGSTIAIRTARPLVLDLDGRGPQTVWTTARTVEEALASFGVRADNSFVSVSRSAPIPREGIALRVRTARAVTVLADGRRLTQVTTAPTFRDVLTEAGVSLGRRDLVSVRLDDAPQPGAVVAVSRITTQGFKRSEPVPFRTERRDDPTRFVGSSVVTRDGRPGLVEKAYEVRVVDGRKGKARLVRSTVKAAPVNRIVSVGTRRVPKASGEVAALNWAALARCESGGRPTAVSSNGLYYGLYQFLPSTWRAVGGSGLPSAASPAEQTYRAQRLYRVANWRTQWPVCGVRLFS